MQVSKKSSRIKGIRFADAETYWGEIGGLISNQTDLQTILDSKLSASHTFHDLLDITAREEPPDPETGKAKIWLSNGTGTGEPGDLCLKVNIDGKIKFKTLFKYPDAAGWDESGWDTNAWEETD